VRTGNPRSCAAKLHERPRSYMKDREARLKTGSQKIGEDWIRTSVGLRQQIYSLPPLATRAPHRKVCSVIFLPSGGGRRDSAVLSLPSFAKATAGEPGQSSSLVSVFRTVGNLIARVFIYSY